MTTPNRFTRYRILILIGAVAVAIVLGTIGLEIGLRALGLGDPVLYDSNPIYGFRPLPNRNYTRLGRPGISFNNFGLRTETAWSDAIGDKVLFLGDSVTFGGDIVGNQDVFAHLSVRDLPGRLGGNAGVNAWGVENIHGLIVDWGFLPASTYVTVLPEGDFNRGLTRIQGLPFYNIRPATALQEVLLHFSYRLNNRRYHNWETVEDARLRHLAVEKAAMKLGAMDAFLRQRGYQHLLFISPSRDQVLNGAAKDPVVEMALASQGLNAIYIGDRLLQAGLSPADRQLVFFDHIHLLKRGHELWATVIAQELQRTFAQTLKADTTRQ